MEANTPRPPIEEKAEQAERILDRIVPGAICIAQEWDDRIDCGIHLDDGSFVGEMIPMRDYSEARIEATGERLKQRANGIPVPLVNALRPPVRILPRR